MAVSPATWIYPTYANCGSTTAHWYVDGPGDFTTVRIGVEDGRSLGPWKFRDSDRPGLYSAGPRNAESDDFSPPGDSTVIKFGSRVSLVAGTRTSNRFPLTGIVSRYSPAADGFRRWADRPVAISYKDCVDCPWRLLAVDRTDSSGAFGLTVISAGTKYYRAAIGDTWNTWGRISQPVRR